MSASTTPPPLAATGRPQPTFDVDASGQASYAIPIEVPPGINGLQPQLSLAYNHRQPNGWLGVGWGLSGLSAITRTKATYAVDGFNGAVSYGPDDRLQLDGQRLLNVRGDYWQAGTVYYTELQSWRFVQASADGMGFMVTQKDGSVWSYGTTADSRILAHTGTQVRVWALASIADRFGNQVLFGYTATPVSGAADEGDYYLASISYTVREGRAADRFVRFDYEARPDPIAAYQGGYPITTSYRLSQIRTTLADGQAVRTYALGYRQSEASGLSCVETITEHGTAESGSPALLPTQLLWQDVTTPGFSVGTATHLDQQPTPLGVQLVDVNGDGRTDLVQLWQDAAQSLHATVYLATPADDGSVTFVRTSDSKLGAWPSTSQILPMDVSGDGRTDLVLAYCATPGQQLRLVVCLSDGQGYAAGEEYNTGDSWNSNSLGFFAADVNGDGRTDLVEAYGYSSPLQGTLLCFRTYLSQVGSNAAAPFGPALVTTTADQVNTAGTLGWYPLDANGDGMMDLVWIWQNKTTSQVYANTYLSASISQTSVTFRPAVQSRLGQLSAKNQLAILPADVNGDGMADLLAVWQEPQPDSTTLHLTSFLCDGAGGFQPGPDSAFLNQVINQRGFYPMGLNGGAQTCLLSKWVSGSNQLMFTTYASRPDGSFVQATQFSAGLAGADMASASFVGGDVNGDGKADLLLLTTGSYGEPVVTPYLSTGPYPDLVTTLTDPLGGQVSVRYAPLTDPAVYQPADQTFPQAEGLRYPNPLTPSQFPVQAVLGQAIYVVAGYDQQNDSTRNRFGYEAHFAFGYTGAQVDLQGRGWQGFRTTSKLSLDSGLRTVQTFNQDFPLTGTVAETRLEADGRYATDPRVPATETALLLGTTATDYTTVVRAGSGTQQVQEVLKTATLATQYSYGQFDFAIGQSFGYDDYGNQTRATWLGYVDPATRQPLATAEVVYHYSSYQNAVTSSGWALGYPLFNKATANATDADISQFATGDYQLAAYTYDPTTGAKLSEANWDDTHDAWLTTSYTQDEYGNQRSKTEPGGARAIYDYETTYHTYLLTASSPPNDQGVILTSSYAYDPRYGTQVAGQDPNGLVTVTALDALGRVVAQQGPVPAGTVADPNQLTPLATGPAALRTAAVVTTATVSYATDGQGGCYVQRQALQAFPTDSSRDWLAQYSYLDGQGRERQTTQPSGQAGQQVVNLTDYTSSGKPLRQAVPFYSSEQYPAFPAVAYGYTYDVLERRTAQQQPDGPNGTAITTTTWYYDLGQQTRQTEAAGTDTAYTQTRTDHYYDSQRRTRQLTINSDGDATTTYAFDALGRATGGTDPATAANPNGVPNTYTLDSLNRQVTFDTPDQNTTNQAGVVARRYTYDAATGHQRQQQDAAGATITLTWDQLSRVVKREFSDGRQVLNTYDQGTNSLGRISHVQVVDAAGHLALQYDYTYDVNGNPDSVTLTIAGEEAPFVTHTVCDPQRRPKQQTLPDGSIQYCTYQCGQLVSQTLGAAQIDYPLAQYTALGKPGQLVYGANSLLTQTNTYNPIGWLYGETMTNGTGAVLDVSYRYDPLSQLLAITDELDDSRSQAYTYRNRRLATATVPGCTAGSYAYDVSGNLTSKDGAAYTYNAHFPLTMTDGGGTELYRATQDACGRTQTRTRNGQTLQFAYDGLGCLASVQNGADVLRTILSDQGGRRVRETQADGTVVLYINAAYQVRRSNGLQTTTAYLADSQGVVAAVRTPAGGPASVEYYRRDHKGSISLVFDGQSGDVLTRIVYDGYGLPSVSGAGGPLPLYEQRGWDEDLTLYYFGARYYDPLTGRFLTPDSSVGSSSLYRADVLNRFAFELNNPINYVDPDGHSAKAWIGGLAIGLTALAAGILVVVSAGTLAPVAGGLAGIATLGFAWATTGVTVATLGTAAAVAEVATTVATVALTVAGSALIAAGMSGFGYSVTHRDNSFSWKNYGIEMGVSAVVGGITGGVSFGVSAAITRKGLSLGWKLVANIVTGGVVYGVGDAVGTGVTDLLENVPGHELAAGMVLSCITGTLFGGLGGALNVGVDVALAKAASRSAAKSLAELGAAAEDTGEAVGETTRLLPRANVNAEADYVPGPSKLRVSVGMAVQNTVALFTEVPESLIENYTHWNNLFKRADA